jgi:hypothetical protein
MENRKKVFGATELSSKGLGGFKSGLWIRIHFNPDPDPAF